MIRRRPLLTCIPLGLQWPSPARGQPGPRVIGVLSPYGSSDVDPARAVFIRAMRDLGYVAGKDFVTMERLAEGRNERLPDLARELVMGKVDAIWASTTNAVAAAQRATETIPIVFESVADPVRAGFVQTLARPGRNMTGLSNFSADLTPKRFQLLKQMIPGLARVGILANSTNPYYSTQLERMRPAAKQLGLALSVAATATPEQLAPAFEMLAQQRAEAVVVTADAYLWKQRARIVELALARRMPSMFAFADCVESGGLMSYGADNADTIRQVAVYIDKILKGARAGDLPVQQPTRLVLTINTGTAKVLGLTIPRTLLLQAERLIP